jgi:hypothetical protein
MRDAESGQVSLFSYVSLEERIFADHPLRVMRALVESRRVRAPRALAALTARDSALATT